MGLKSKLNKMKNFLFDEEEIEKSEKKKIKNKKEDEKDFVIEKSNEKIEKYEEDFYFNDVSDNEVGNTIEVKSRMTKEKEKENEFKFPEFNEEDFMTPVREEPRFEPVKKTEAKPILYQGSKRREETKKFKPSPIISPIYGLLDNNGNSLKVDEKKKDELPTRNKDEKKYDEIRKKAYGALDDEFENTIFKLSKKTLEEAEADMEEEEKANQEVYYKTREIEELYKKPVVEESEEDDMVLPTVNFKEIDIKEKCGKKDQKQISLEEDDEDTKEQDLFNLIDTIYSGEEK